MNRPALLILLVAMALASCKSSKIATGPTAKVERMDSKALIDSANAHQINFEWFSAKAKCEYDDGKHNHNFTANIRMQRDSVIWVSITSLMGIEVARILISPDSIELIDKLKKDYVKQPFSFLETYAPYPLDISLLQDMIVGNYLLDTLGEKKTKVKEGLHQMQVESEKFSIAYHFLPEIYRVDLADMEEKLTGRKLKVSASDYQPSPNGNFANERSIIFTDNKKTYIRMKFSRVVWDEIQTFPFYVSEKYDE
ncbi:MAG: DUF4292 domain-containing protein [Chitinophagales bacterium]|nr:DUF4292 domain-containing protein [Chitinophagales bacterium]